jgi:hypothetical protein
METTSLRERQLHMTQLLKKLDRLIVEKHGKFNLPFYHYQRPLAAPGERDSVCVYVDSVKREYLPYGVELEKLVEDARLWVRTGEGPRPEVMVSDEKEETEEKPAVIKKRPVKSKEEGTEAPSASAGSRRKLMNLRESASARGAGQRARPPG